MKFFEELINIKPEKSMGIYNTTDEFFCLYLNEISTSENKNILVVVNTIYEANKLYNSLIEYTDKVSLFPMDDFLTSEALAISPDLMINRLETINKVITTNNNIVITNLTGYLRYLPLKKNYEKSIINLRVGEIISHSDLVERLTKIGYIRDSIVNKTGEFGVRGFIIDIYPIDEDNPVRVEFFDDEIESIRYFDSDTQKSLESIKEIEIKPYFEFITEKEVEEEHYGRQKYLPRYTEVTNISNYLDNPITVFKDFEQLSNSYFEIENEIKDYRREKDLDFKDNYMFNFDLLNVDYPIYYSSLNNLTPNSYIDKEYNFNVKTINNFNENPEVINKFIKEYLKNKYTIVIALKKYQIKSVKKYLDETFIETTLDNIKLNKLNIVEQELSEGFIYNDFILLTAHELFKQSYKKTKYNTKYKYSKTIEDINKLDVGDYVVHNVHGIGIYNGIKTLTLNNISKDYLEILYQGTDKIYIPVEKIDYLSKYSGREGVAPKISKLGGSEWKKTKNRIRNKVTDIAEKLIKLYAERESKKGYAFSPDCDLSKEFESDFEHELTVDQKRAITQIKEDMEKITPMDRLLCGDVGFGKTEVAFVAAFKAILDSKQVLFLCPTTILSKQHYDNALLRFKNFPVNIALLNRFTTKKEVGQILEGLKSGTIDMVIGTHRLLSDDIKLKDLGLLIIDEEQRFGVTHKEKIKEYKTNVDVLTLSATPIPRTLQMSLTGLRSLSLIETPPINRYPIQTYVVEENKQILKEAILKELSRNGQVFILYNKIQTIEEFRDKIERIVPDARICIAHGQMNKEKLENTIYDFVNYQYDILICTTIIETGIDIPNVNTLIIMDADRFGLSQLYQIRGRVGRSDKFAYAYLMYQPFKTLTETAVKRLNVIKEFTELGSGFSIATRDLSIRGAGDILGSEQAGFIDSVGIDLYMKILNEEVEKLNNGYFEEEVEDSSSKQLIEVATHIDDNYVSDEELKIEIHRLINSVKNKETFNLVKEELEDRFGKLDEDLIIYMYEEWFERLASQVGLSNIHQNRNSIELVFSQEFVERINIEDLFMMTMDISRMFRFKTKGSNLLIILDLIKLDRHPIYYLVELLDKIYDKFYK